MKQLHTFICSALLLASCGSVQNQTPPSTRLVGGPCEGCEAIFEFGDKVLSPVDTLPDFNGEGGQRIKVTGTIFLEDGKTPAKDVILYLYHTDHTGVYPTQGGETGWEKRHGFIRGWIKTGADGKYAFFTRKPGAYPGWTAPAHMHATILEPNGKYYWLDDYLFSGDTLLSDRDINPAAPRGGGTGLLELTKAGDIAVGTRDILLGKNIPQYE